LRHVANGKAFDCFGYGDTREKRKPSHGAYRAKDFDYVLYVLLEVMDARYLFPILYKDPCK